MAYRFATERHNHEDLAGGAVLRSLPGLPAFPVRLASEVFQRALALRGADGPVTVWDPCCGSGYLLAVLGFLHRDRVAALVASDVDAEALAVARANLALLTADGLAARRAELADLADRYGKPSHAAAVRACDRLAATPDVPSTVFPADVLQLPGAPVNPAVDLVVVDPPYGEQVGWSAGGSTAAMLRSLAAVLGPEAVVAVGARGRRVDAGPHRPVESLRVGTRAVALFRAGSLTG